MPQIYDTMKVTRYKIETKKTVIVKINYIFPEILIVRGRNENLKIGKIHKLCYTSIAILEFSVKK